jgi:UDP-N-acetylglucosamine diphosphorylase/glucosamine-1-phosphate N-acetyltransferase
MTDVYLVEPAPAPAWRPFAECRPICELRVGAWLARERWEAVAAGETRAVFGPSHLQEFEEDGVPPIVAAGPIEGPAVVGRSEFAPSGVAPDWSDEPARLVNDGVAVGWYVPEGVTWNSESVGWPDLPIDGFLLHGAYDLITGLEHLLVGDVADFTHERGDALPDGCVVIGDPTDVVLFGATVEPGVVFDVRQGAVVLEQHTYVRGGTRLGGPLYVGAGCEVLGGDIGRSAIGPRSKVRGEITDTVFLGYGNKAHDGFLGHSVVGRWVNIGAGTTTSNLKNTYGSIRLDVGGERVDTGLQFLGTLFGDHVKVAIGTLLDTGTVVGSGANVFGAVRPPKYLPPFAWGVSGERMRKDAFLEVVDRVLPRRQVAVTSAVRDALARIYDHATG